MTRTRAFFSVAVAMIAIFVTGPTRADEASVDSPAASARTAVDSEQQLIERRETRLGALPAPPSPPTVEGPTFNPIDQFIVAGWSKASGGPSPQLCDDATFLRRVYLDVIGVIPTSTEANRFLVSPANQAKREKLVDQLLARKSDYAAHWTPFWRPPRARTARVLR